MRVTRDCRVKGKGKINNRKAYIGALTVALVLVAVTGLVRAGMDPPELYATVAVGGSFTETKTVTIPALPPKGDVVFAFDLTGSMSAIINTAKTNAGLILSTLDATPDVSFNYGVMSYMDYPNNYNSCGYWATYGSGGGCGDYAYSLDQAVTGDTGAVTTAIGNLVLGCGGDGPQDYTRIFYESYADTNVAWRDGAKRVLVNFGDNIPHDCNLNEGVTSGTWSTGGDPGRNEVMGDSDDLDLQTVLADMATAGVTLLEAHTTTGANTYWAYWTGLTGGDVFITNSANLVDDVVAEILAALEPVEVTGLHLEFDGECALGMSTVPAEYPSVDPETPVDFEVTFTAPDDPGIYSCTVSARDDADVSYGEQLVQIVAYDPSAGFVTGGGWIDSPEGAFTGNSDLVGKANFGFVAKYKKGASEPIGQTEFQFQVADLNFHSESYQWLLITHGGTFAKFKGAGTINGQPGPWMDEPFKFMLWAGDDYPDTFRIKIWWEDEFGDEQTVYDNGMDQAIGGGSIVIHTKK